MDNQSFVNNGLLESKTPEPKWDKWTILRLIALIIALASLMYIVTPS